MPVIEIRNLSYRYPDGDEPVLRDVNVQIASEHIVGILGQSGSGKTTLLNCLARFLAPTAGAILLDGRDIASLSEKEYRRNVGVVFQRLNLFPHMTVLENLVLAPVKSLGASARRARRESREMLERLSIGELADRYPSQISGGQAQRVAIARALALQPRYLLLDEPTSALDAQTTGEFGVWLRELRHDICFIIVTHDLPFAEQVATQGIFLSEGRVRAAGPVAEIIDQASAPSPAGA